MTAPTGLRLRALTGETFAFEPGADCLAFGYTGGEGYRAAHETLHSPADLQRWFEQWLGDGPVAVDAMVFAAARRLRDAIWQCVDAVADGHPLPADAVAEVNRRAGVPPLSRQIDAAARSSWRIPVTGEAMLSVLARDAVEVLGGPSVVRIRRCAGADCPLIFVDTSRPGRRRWCSMQRCGNRAKVHAFRHREHEENPA